jgi:hypothetical protein
MKIHVTIVDVHRGAPFCELWQGSSDRRKSGSSLTSCVSVSGDSSDPDIKCFKRMRTLQRLSEGGGLWTRKFRFARRECGLVFRLWPHVQG